MFKRAMVVGLTIMSALVCKAQKSDSFIQTFRPISIATGIPLEKEGENYTGGAGSDPKNVADTKFQISLAIPLWKNIGGTVGRNLFVGYTQACLWNFYDRSSPMRDNTFIPGIYFNLPWENDNLLLGIEHRSNGRPFTKTGKYGDEEYSRSLNHLLAEYTHSFAFGLSLQASVKGGYGWYNEELCQDVYYRYFGYATFSAFYESPDRKFSGLVSLTPTFDPFSANINAEFAYRPFKKDYLPSFFVQFYSGWDSAMCDWVRGANPPAPRLRIGIMFATDAAFRMSR